MFAFFLSLALRFPAAAKFISNAWGFVRRNWKEIAAVLILIFAWFKFVGWRDDLVASADAAGFARAEKEYTAAVTAANERERRTQANIDKLSIAFDALGQNREQAVTLTVKPILERVTNEVANDLRYRECAVSDGVLFDINAGRSAADASIAASNSRQSEQRP